MSAQEALHKLEALPDIRKEAERLNVRDEDLTRKISKLKAEYMQKKLNFIVTDPQQYKGTCKVCNQEVTAVEYELFKEGVKLNITLDALSIHRAKDHAENFSQEVIDFLFPNQNKKRKITVDRDNVCPFYLKIFIRHNQVWKEEEFKVLPKEGETVLHAWKDTTLREITDLLKESIPVLRQPGVKLSFNVVFPDKRGQNVLKEAGSTESNRFGKEDSKTLDDARYELGDYLAISLHERDKKQLSSVVATSSTSTDQKQSNSYPNKRQQY